MIQWIKTPPEGFIAVLQLADEIYLLILRVFINGDLYPDYTRPSRHGARAAPTVYFLGRRWEDYVLDWKFSICVDHSAIYFFRFISWSYFLISFIHSLFENRKYIVKFLKIFLNFRISFSLYSSPDRVSSWCKQTLKSKWFN